MSLDQDLNRNYSPAVLVPTSWGPHRGTKASELPPRPARTLRPSVYVNLHQIVDDDYAYFVWRRWIMVPIRSGSTATATCFRRSIT